MEAAKGLRAQYGEEELASLLESLDGSIRLYRADDAKGAPIALRACAFQDGKAWDLLAASNEEGRRSYASYALLWSLLRDCAARGIQTYDLGGADPDKAKGVYDFKKGTGAKFIEYLGEWDWARPALARPFLSAIVGVQGS
jgi:lipid II:glycine glycyltransferase (peptidoglycan interpeptide bridge formation enzyme)